MTEAAGGVAAGLPTGMALSVHRALLDAICSRAHRLRKSRPAAAIPAEGRLDVLHVISAFELGGTQRQLMGLLTSRGSGEFRHSATEIFPERNILYRRGENIDPARYSRGSFLSRLPGKLTENMRTRSLQVVQIYKLTRDFRSMTPHVVVGWGHEAAMLTFTAAALARVPGIFFSIRTLNPAYSWSPLRDLMQRAHSRMVPFVDGVVVNSSFLQRDYASWAGLKEEAVSVCHNGVPAPEDDPRNAAAMRAEVRQRHGIPRDGTVILSAGRFSEEKGQVLLLQAFGDLVGRYPGRKLSCVLCGDGPELEEAQRYVAGRALRGVVFTGLVHDVGPYFHGADIFVMPSYYEGMPNALLEAMASGLPAITTNRSGVRDVARDGEEVLYVDVAAVDQMVEKLSFLLERPEERERIGERARNRMGELTFERMIGNFEEILAKSRIPGGARSCRS